MWCVGKSKRDFHVCVVTSKRDGAKWFERGGGDVGQEFACKRQADLLARTPSS